MPAFSCPAESPTTDRVVCRCLRVTETTVITAVATCAIRDLRDLRRKTGAGTGCNGCHRLLTRYLEAQSSSSVSPICSVK
jgi:nitrite reductase (NADH) large subunit